jgi:hypothetical protein
LSLSIVVPVRQAQRTLLPAIDNLLAECRGLPAEVIVVCSADDETSRLIADRTDAQLQVIVKPGRHSVPQLRRDAVRQSQAEFIVITEDHCLVPAGWVRLFLELPSKHPASAWGGPVSNGRRSLLGWCQYFTRYSAFLPPGNRGYTKALPGNNACYRREHLIELAGELSDGFWEAEFNTVLAECHGPFWFEPALGVEQRQHRGLIEYFSLRYRHGRCYGARSGRPISAIFPAVTAILMWRAFRNVWRRGEKIFLFLLVSPLLSGYFLAWALGEMTGYLRGPGDSCSDTD